MRLSPQWWPTTGAGGPLWGPDLVSSLSPVGPLRGPFQKGEARGAGAKKYLLTYLLTNYLFTYSRTNLLAYSLTHLLTYSDTLSPIQSSTHLLSYLLTYLLTYLHIYSLSYLLSYLLTYLLTYTSKQEIFLQKLYLMDALPPPFWRFQTFIAAAC